MAEFETPTAESSASDTPASPPAEERSRKSALLIVFLVVFVDLLGFGIVLPLLPLYATELLQPIFPGDDKTAHLLRGVLLGLLMASCSLMQFFFAPFWGRVSDRVGRRHILLLGLAGSVVFYTLFGVASILGGAIGLTLLFVSRIGAGIAGATIATAQAVIADCTPPEKRAHGMALIGAAFGIGFTVGPLLGFASLFVESAGAPGFAAAILSCTALVLGALLLPETLRPGVRAGRRRLFDWQSIRRVLLMPTIGLLVLSFFLATLAFGSLESTLALVNKLLLTGQVERNETITREALKTTERSNFLVFAYVGFVLMLIQGFVYRRFVQRVGEVRFLRLGVLLMALGLAGAVVILLVRESFSPGVTTLALGLPVMTLAVVGFAFMTPSVQALISRRADPTQQGEVLGVNQSASALARILGPFLGITTFFVPPHIVPFAGGCVLLILVFMLTLRIQPD
jgi:DHA1 family tetracycline resistance protein-like MFS transporter